jgi:glycosyltransferase involved in cell wall biosynthesis
VLGKPTGSAPPVTPALSAIVLGYRAGHSLTGVVDQLSEQLAEGRIDFEIVVVANFDSPPGDDETPAVAARLAARNPRVRVVALPKQGGMGWDMRSGLEAARGAFRLVIDGDGQNPVEDVLRAYEMHLSTGADLVKGRRSVRGDGPARKVMSVVYNALFLLLFGTRGLGDINGKPKGITDSALDRMNLRSDDWFIDAEIVLEARRLELQIAELPVRFQENRHRASFVNWKTVLEFIRNMLARRLRRD